MRNTEHTNYSVTSETRAFRKRFVVLMVAFFLEMHKIQKSTALKTSNIRKTFVPMKQAKCQQVLSTSTNSDIGTTLSFLLAMSYKQPSLDFVKK